MLAWAMNLGFAGSGPVGPVSTGTGVSSSGVSKSNVAGGAQFGVSGAHVTRDTGVTKKLP